MCCPAGSADACCVPRALMSLPASGASSPVLGTASSCWGCVTRAVCDHCAGGPLGLNCWAAGTGTPGFLGAHTAGRVLSVGGSDLPHAGVCPEPRVPPAGWLVLRLAALGLL